MRPNLSWQMAVVTTGKQPIIALHHELQYCELHYNRGGLYLGATCKYWAVRWATHLRQSSFEEPPLHLGRQPLEQFPYGSDVPSVPPTSRPAPAKKQLSLCTIVRRSWQLLMTIHEWELTSKLTRRALVGLEWEPNVSMRAANPSRLLNSCQFCPGAPESRISDSLVLATESSLSRSPVREIQAGCHGSDPKLRGLTSEGRDARLHEWP